MRGVPFTPGRGTAMDEYPFDRRVQVLQSPDMEPTLQEAAFTSILTEHQNRMLGIAKRFTATEASAEDAFQEASMRVHRNIGSFEPRGPMHLKNWLTTIATRAAMDRFERETLHTSRTISMTGVEGEDLSETLQSDIETPEEAAIAREEFKTGIALLRKRHWLGRNMIFLTALGYSRTEISEIFDDSPFFR